MNGSLVRRTNNFVRSSHFIFVDSGMAQAINLLGDLKLGHYMKIPPRSMLVSQL